MNTITSAWVRVTKQSPCPICNHEDWCCLGEIFINCMRVSSDKPAKNGGFLHKVNDEYLKPYVPIRKTSPEVDRIDFNSIWQKWYDETPIDRLIEFGERLGVGADALAVLGCAYSESDRAWAFPMKNSGGNIIGIRLRNEKGDKWAVKGSKQGLFIPERMPSKHKVLFVTEGPTDCAAALHMLLLAVGRPSCLGCELSVNEYALLNKINHVIIVSDNDTPGLNGAKKLQMMLKMKSCIWTPPAKDLREFLKNGGDKISIQACVNGLVWTNPKI